MCGMDVGNIPHGFGASTTAQRLLSAPSSSDPGFQLTSQIWTNKCGGNVMMTDPYPHPKHMKVIKHLIYVWNECANNSTWIWRLNH
jgi:hypothetical protein